MKNGQIGLEMELKSSPSNKFVDTSLGWFVSVHLKYIRP